MSECLHYLFIKNNKIKPCEDFNEQILNQGTSVYDVLRVMQGRSLFLEEHLNRLYKSASHIGQHIWLSQDEIGNQIDQLIQLNGVDEGNIKIIFNYFRKERNFFCYFIPHNYPNQEQYQTGVDTILYKAIRENPNAKVVNNRLRKTTNEIIEKAHVFEVILLDQMSNITEGSRSNIFFIKGNNIHTPPLSDVLPGTVRERVISISKELRIPLIEKRIPVDDLNLYQAAFLTGTSLMILPVSNINNLSFDVQNPLLRRLMDAYHYMISQQF